MRLCRQGVTLWLTIMLASLTGPLRAQQFTAGYQQLTITATAAGLTGLAGMSPVNRCSGTLETAPIRVRWDGTPPTSTVGQLVNVGDKVFLNNLDDIQNFLAIRTTTTSGVLNMNCETGTGVPLTPSIVQQAVPYSSLSIPGATVTGDLLVSTATSTVGSLPDVATGQVLTSAGVGVVPAYSASPVVTSLGATGNIFIGGTGLAGGAGVDNFFTKTVTGLVDAAATNVLTVTVPNTANAAVIPVILLTSLGAGGAIGAFECSGTAYGQIVVARTPGVATVATATALSNTGSACVAGATTIATAYAVTAMTGAVGATQTFSVTVTITKGGGASAAHQVILEVDMTNANTAGITIS